MALIYFTNGDTVVRVDGSDLGIADKQIEIIPRFHHRDIRADDYGEKMPAEVMWELADLLVTFTLVHFNSTLLNTCIRKSMGGGTLGTFVGAGTMMTDNYMSLNIPSPVQSSPWTFPKSYLAERPIVWPLGNERSAVQCTWRAIGVKSFASEMTSAGAVLFS